MNWAAGPVAVFWGAGEFGRNTARGHLERGPRVKSQRIRPLQNLSELDPCKSQCDECRSANSNSSKKRPFQSKFAQARLSSGRRSLARPPYR